MAHGGGGGGEGIEVNLIPMIDIVIQLITFFLMLVNFDQSNQDERVQLPIADLAKPAAMEIDEMLILNVNRDGFVNMGLGDLVDPDSTVFRTRIAQEAALAKKNMMLAKKRVKMLAGRPELWTTVLIRADKDVESGKVQRMIKTCQDVGFYKFALRASPEKSRM
jgi:biopolymer transport protein ExbD